MLLLLIAALAFGSPKDDYLAGKPVPKEQAEAARVQAGDASDEALEAATKKLALTPDEAARALALYRRAVGGSDAPEHAARSKIETKGMEKRLSGLGGVFGPDRDAGALPAGAAAPQSGAGGSISAAALPRAQVRHNPAQSAAPPVVLHDIVQPPEGMVDKVLNTYVFKNSQSAQVLKWLAARPSAQEAAEINETLTFLEENTSARGLKHQLMIGAGDQEGMHIRVNYGPMDSAKHGATVPFIGHAAIAARNAGQKASVTFNQDLRQSPVEVRALVAGHELRGHGMDVESGFISNPGAQIPSEVRALVLDARHYLEILAKVGEERAKELNGHKVWQLGNVKARMALGLDVWPTDYKDPQVQRLARVVYNYKKANPSAQPPAVVRHYVKEVYKSSGETGIEKIDLKDDSAVGSYNKQTDVMLEELKKSFTLPEFER